MFVWGKETLQIVSSSETDSNHTHCMTMHVVIDRINTVLEGRV